jgi:hypothetical protein
MEHHRTFGRRPGSRPQATEPAPRIPLATAAAVSPPAAAGALASIEDEIEEWKQARGYRAIFPWRQLSLMAGLCFGVASFVLPNQVNDVVQWPLYILAAISFYAGLRKRKNKTA